MSLRYKLNKDKFKGKKLPPKIKTNEDHISEDQKGNHSSDDKDLLSLHKLKASLKKPIEQQEISRRGLFGSLNQLKEYADESDRKEKERKKIKRKKIRLKEEEELNEQNDSLNENLSESNEALEETGNEAKTEIIETEKPKRGFFRRVVERFYPTLEDPEEIEARKLEKKRIKAEKLAAKNNLDSQSSDTKTPDSEIETSIEQTQEIPSSNSNENHDEESEEERSDEDVEMNRRNLMRKSVHFFAKPTVDKIQGKIDKVNQTVDKITKRIPLLRPPGAISERAFLQACTRCDKCINACPKDAIQRVPKKHGFLIMDTPYIDPVKVPCVMCNDLPCIPACPDGALLPVPGGREEAKMGYAILDKKKCQAYGDTFCQQCIIDCPIPGVITQKDQKPIINKKTCTGCGVCVRSCSTVNIPVAIKIKPQMVIEWQAEKKAMEEKQREIEAQKKAAALVSQSEEDDDSNSSEKLQKPSDPETSPE